MRGRTRLCSPFPDLSLLRQRRQREHTPLPARHCVFYLDVTFHFNFLATAR